MGEVIGRPAVVQVLAPRLALLADEGVDYAIEAVLLMVQRTRVNGIEPPWAVRALLAGLAAAGTTSGTTARVAAVLNGTAEPSAIPLSAQSPKDFADVEEVAQVLEVSEGYARRLFRDEAFTTGHKATDGSWRVDRLELRAWRQDRQEARSA